MKFTLSWLKDHLETQATLEEVSTRLTALGLEVEGIEEPSKTLAGFVVAEILKAEKHPDADKLQVCQVNAGGETIQVICGAPNARQGLKVCLAQPGAIVPNDGMAIKQGKIRGVRSEGMLCSPGELNLEGTSDGILELETAASPGTPFAEAYGINDPIIEIAITPDRADCLGVRGIARDLCAAGLGELKPLPRSAPVKGSFPPPIRWKRQLEGTEDACPHVVGRVFRNLKNGPSPKWLQQRLQAIGLRPISRLVDVTNYVSYDLGRPLHVFDVDGLKLDAQDPALTMRLARAGEQLEALNDKTYALTDEMTVIADQSGPQAIGGVMGGLKSGCTEATVTCFLEVALFATTRTAKTGRALQIESDARYRFERWVDPQSNAYGTDVATQLILELCGGEASELTAAGTPPQASRQLTLRFERIPGLTGVAVSPERSQEILGRLGFGIVDANEDHVTVTVPSHRHDIGGEPDLVEEVVRVLGFDAIPTVPLTRTTALPTAAISPSQRRVSRVRRRLASRGLLECVTYAFTSTETAAKLGATPKTPKLANPIASDLDRMRPSVLAHLLPAIARNQNRGAESFSLFEVGPAYLDDTPTGQHTHAAGIRVGATGSRHWSEAPRTFDAYDAKADALAVLATCGLNPSSLQVHSGAPEHYHPGRSGELRLGPKVTLARFGELHPTLLENAGGRGRVCAFEVDLSMVPAEKNKKSTKLPAYLAPDLLSLERDFAFIVDATTPAAELAKAARASDKQWITDVSIFDVFEGRHLEPGKKSIALTVTLQPQKKALTDQEIEVISQHLIDYVSKKTGAKLR